jgi:hypothetical protein
MVDNVADEEMGGSDRWRRRLPEEMLTSSGRVLDPEQMKEMEVMICKRCVGRGDDRWSVVKREMAAAVVKLGGGQR